MNRDFRLAVRGYIRGLISLIFFLNYSQVCAQISCQNVEWMKEIKVSGNALHKAIVADSFGNLYVTGQVSDMLVYGNQSFVGSIGKKYIYVLKVNGFGSVIWAKLFEGSTIKSTSIAIDKDHNPYLCGSYKFNAYFDSIHLQSQGENMYLLKLDTTGKVKWVGSTKGDSSSVETHNIAIDSLGNCYVTGSALGSTVFGSDTFLSQSNSYGFVCKWNSAGSICWTKTNRIAQVNWSGLSLSTNNRFYVAIDYSGMFVWDSDTFPASYGQSDVGIFRMDSSGKIIWFRKFGGKSYEKFFGGINADKLGNCYITGSFRDTAIAGVDTLISGGSEDNFFLKINETGNFVWARSGGSSGLDYSYKSDIDNSGNFYVVGTYDSYATYGNITVTGSYMDLFILKLDSSGNFLWIKKGGSSGIDIGACLSIYGDNQLFALLKFDGSGSFNGSGVGSSSSADFDLLCLIHDDSLIVYPMTNQNLHCGKEFVLPGNVKGFKTLKWLPNYNLNSDSVIRPVATPTQSVTYWLKATDRCGNSDSQDIRINVIPYTIRVSVQDSISICGDTNYLFAENVDSVPNLTFSWYPVQGILNQGLQGTSLIANASRLVSATATTSSGCVSSGAISVQVVPYQFNVNVVSDTLNCGDGTYLFADILDTNSSYIYSWTPIKNMNYDTVPSPFVSPVASGYYTLNLSLPIGCSYSDSTYIHVNSIPLTIQLIDSVIPCNGTTTMEATHLDTSTQVSYKWNPTFGLSNPVGKLTAVSNSVSGYYYLEAAKADGCKGIDSVYLTVVPFSAYINASDTLINCGDTIQLQAGTIENVSNLRFAWRADSSLSDTSISSPVAFPGAANKYFVEIYTSSGCSALDSIEVNLESYIHSGVSIVSSTGSFTLCDTGLNLSVPGFNQCYWGTGDSTLTLTVIQPGSYSVIARNSIGCFGYDTVHLEKLSRISGPDSNALCPGKSMILNGPGNFHSYNWSTGDTTRGIVLNTPGTYWLKLHQQSCISTDTFIVVQSSIVAVANFNYLDTGLRVHFYPNSPSIKSLIWYFGDGDSSVDFSPIHKYGQGGTYDVTLIVTDECGNVKDTTMRIQVGPMGILFRGSKGVRVYPNPTNGLVRVNSDYQIQNIELFDILGRRVLFRDVTTNDCQINLEEFPSGSYLMRLNGVFGEKYSQIIIRQ